MTYAFDFNGDGSADITNSTGLATYTFPNAGPSTVGVTVSDAYGGSTNTTYTVNVNEVAPTLSLTSSPSSAVISVGSPLQLNLNFTTLLNHSVLSYTVNWGDGSTPQTYSVNSDGLSPTHLYGMGDVTPTVVVSGVTTDEGNFGQLGTLPVTVQNVPPQIAVSGPGQVVQGLPYTLTLGAVTDPGPDDITGYTVNWGDGLSDNFTGNPVRGTTITHSYGPAFTGTQTISVTLDDQDGAHPQAGQTTILVQADTPPTANAGGPYTVAEGSSLQLSAALSSDPDQSAASLTYTWDFQGNFLFADASGIAPTFSATNLDGSGSVTVSVRVTEAQGESSVASATVNITNVAPTATLANSGTVAVDSPVTVSFSGASDPSIADTRAGFHYSFATDPTALATSYAAANGASSSAFTFDDVGTYTVYGRILDKDSGFTDYSTTVTVTDVAPTAVLSNSGPVAETNSVTVSFGGASDPSTAATRAGFHYSFATDPTALATSYAAASATASAAFTFDDAGTYMIYGRILDKNGGFTDYTTTVTVTDVAPTAVFTNSGPVAAGSTTATVSFSNQTDPSPAARQPAISTVTTLATPAPSRLPAHRWRRSRCRRLS